MAARDGGTSYRRASLSNDWCCLQRSTDDRSRATMTTPLSRRLREETRERHTIAERSGIMRPLLRQQLEPQMYALLVRNLHPLYAALEQGLRAHAADPLIAPFSNTALARTGRLERDLVAIAGSNWASALPRAETARGYAERLASASASGLFAHAYVRYFGDLSGGQQIARIVRRSLGAELESAVEFYDFSDLGDVDAYKEQVRAAMDALVMSEQTQQEIVDEALWAFEAHAALFDELDALRTSQPKSATDEDATR
jgi:heme oxygenase